MNRVMVRLRLRVCTTLARYLLFLDAITEKMARAFAEGVTTSKKLSLERCGLKNPVLIRVRVRVRFRVKVRLTSVGKGYG